MTGEQVFFVVVAFVTLAIFTVAAQFKWLPPGTTMTVLVFIAGVVVVLALYLAKLPPAWFSASKTGFGLGLSLTIGAFFTRGPDEKAFGFPLLFGMGVTLLVTNFLALI